ncbi:hypothetical protein HMPREF9443_01276, partial [Phascolarctobacterium succinatutens YIT 12067]
MAVAYIFIPGPLSGPDFFHIRQIESLLQYTKIQHTQYHLYDKHYYCFQNFLLTLFFLFFILSLASHLQQNKQCLSAYVGSNLAVLMVSELSDAMCTAFL